MKGLMCPDQVVGQLGAGVQEVGLGRPHLVWVGQGRVLLLCKRKMGMLLYLGGQVVKLSQLMVFIKVLML